MDRLTAVCPLLHQDLDRFGILLRSLDRFFDPDSLQDFMVIVRDEELESIKQELQGLPKRHQISLVPERELNLQTHLSPGWFRQQLIKLKIATKIESTYYLVLDADNICCKAVAYDQLIPNGRALMTRVEKQAHRDWWKWSAKLLGTRPGLWRTALRLWKPRIRTSPKGMDVTPAILSTSSTLNLIDYLQRRWQLPLGEILSDHRFTEYTLYYLFLEMNGLVHQLHQTDAPVSCIGKGMNVWAVNEFEDWNVQRLFSDPAQLGFFTVCQSNTGISPEAVWQKIRPYVANQREKF
jgi:hypothetical protein